MSGMLRAVRRCLHRIADPTVTRGVSLSGRLMPGLAVLSPGIPSPPRSGTRVRGGGDLVAARSPRAPRGEPPRRAGGVPPSGPRGVDRPS